MKNDFSHSPLYSQHRFSHRHATGRTSTSGSTAAGPGLRREDGFDWLRRIKPAQTGQRAGQ